MRTLATLALTAALLAACGQQSASDMAIEESKAEAQADQKTLAEGKAWLAQNAGVAGMVTLPSGVQYRVVKEGPEGGRHPTIDDEVTIHYEGRLIDGTVFDSSIERGEPASFPLRAVIPGWAEAVTKMTPGDVFEVFIPPEQAYGPTPKGPIPGNSVLIFRIELFDITGPAAPSALG